MGSVVQLSHWKAKNQAIASSRLIGGPGAVSVSREVRHVSLTLPSQGQYLQMTTHEILGTGWRTYCIAEPIPQAGRRWFTATIMVFLGRLLLRLSGRL